MKIIDTFLFYNEEKLLDFRLNYYKGFVDYFIVVEATKTKDEASALLVSSAENLSEKKEELISTLL
jgi:hypothetical protein